MSERRPTPSIPHGGAPRAVGPACLISFAAAALVACSAAAEPYWVMLADAPGRIPGDAVSPRTVERVRGAGGRIRTISRYLNAVSVDFDGNPREIGRIPGVVSVRPVGSMGLPRDERAGPPEAAKSAWSLTGASGAHGLLADELGMLGVPALNDRGYTGKGVTIGVVDTGFDAYRTTGCLAGVNVAASRNFITGAEDVSGDSHGTWTLACIAGNLAGVYQGAAPDASFLLAVTDDVATETRADEDRWVAAVEWCDSLGADIVSSSLVYNEFDTPADSYTKDQMDGRTSLVARAAEIAASRGIVMVNSVGNEGNLPWRIVTTPGDAAHVIAVGAVTVTTTGTPSIAPFSSRGPTADGRIKPDVVAPGVSVDVPVPGEQSNYLTISGTSLAAPFVTGLCALLIEARPGLSPESVMTALTRTARDLGAPGPDNTYGWGLPDGTAALASFPASVHENDRFASGGEMRHAEFNLLAPYPNPFNPRVTIPFSVSRASRVTIEVFDVTGRRVAVVADGPSSPGLHAMVWDAGGFAAGMYLVRGRAENRTVVEKVLLVK